MNVFQALKTANFEQSAVWTISWQAGYRFDKKRGKRVHDVQEINVVGTQNAAAVAQRVVSGLQQQLGFTDANEAVQMKRAGYLA